MVDVKNHIEKYFVKRLENFWKDGMFNFMKDGESLLNKMAIVSFDKCTQKFKFMDFQVCLKIMNFPNNPIVIFGD